MKISFSNRWFIFLAFAIIGCKKEKEPQLDPAVQGYRIKAIAGANQTDTIGRPLKDSLVFDIAKDGKPVSSGFIRFETRDCDNEIQTEEWPIVPAQSVLPYQWRLNGTAGKQYLKAVLLDAARAPQDSIIIAATGLPPKQGWYPSGCFPSNTFAVSFARLPSGRILAALKRRDYPWYSDDGGITWHPLKTLSGQYNITKLIATPQNEVFLSIGNVGMYYSGNGGQTWDLRNNGLPLSGFWGDIQYTKSGKLFVLTQNGVYASANKGFTWTQAMQGLSFYSGFSHASSTTEGSILAIHDNRSFRSTDGGQSWREVYSLSSTAGLSSLFVDDNGDVYIAVATGIGMSYGLYVSKDNAQTWSKIYTPVPATVYDYTISEVTKQNGVYYFYATSENVLIKTTDFITYTPLQPPVGSNNGRRSFRYVVAGNNNLVLSTEWYGLYYFLP